MKLNRVVIDSNNVFDRADLPFDIIDHSCFHCPLEMIGKCSCRKWLIVGKLYVLAQRHREKHLVRRNF